MAESAMLHVRIDGKLKAEALQALSAIGLSASDAVRLLFHRIVAEQAFPLELKVPNAETRAAMAEADEIIRTGKARFQTAEEMFASLEAETGTP
jgi:DNA-damage-inducible protein J